MPFKSDALGTERNEVGSVGCSSNRMVQEPHALKLAVMDVRQIGCSIETEPK